MNKNCIAVLDDKYYLEKIIGNGLTSKVFLASDIKDCLKKYAIKILTHKRFIDSFKAEKKAIDLLTNYQERSQVNCFKNIVKQYDIKLGVLVEGRNELKVIYTVSEYESKGELFDFIKNKNFSEKSARTLFLNILQSVQMCHHAGFCHRDLKLDNIFVNENFEIKLGDFGFSKEYDGKTFLNDQCGTKYYIAPEILEMTPYDGFKVDLFSLGIILFAIVVGNFPFQMTKRKDKTFEMIRKKRFNDFWKEVEKFTQVTYTEALKDLFNSLVAVNPKERVSSVEEVLNNPWFKMEASSQEELAKELKERYSKKVEDENGKIFQCK